MCWAHNRKCLSVPREQQGPREGALSCPLRVTPTTGPKGCMVRLGGAPGLCGPEESPFVTTSQHCHSRYNHEAHVCSSAKVLLS